MKSTSLLLVLLSLSLPTSTEAFIADLFSFIVGIFFPNWQDQLCDALTANIPDELGTCGCDISLSGLFDFDVSATCEDVGDLCDITVGGEGNIFLAVFSGTQITVGSECPLETSIGSFGTLTLNGEGTLSISGSDIDGCSAVYDPPSIIPEVSCDCTPGCDGGAPFSVSVTCLGFIELGCVNFFDVLTEIDFANLPPPE